MIMDLEKVIDKELERLGYDIEGAKTADFTDGFVRGYNYAQEQVKNCSIPDVSNQRELLKAFLSELEEVKSDDAEITDEDAFISQFLKAFNCC